MAASLGRSTRRIAASPLEDWRNAASVLHRTGTGLVRAEEQFRRVRGHKALPELIAPLENADLRHRQPAA